MSGFQWNAKREEAALLVAEDRLTDDEIAKQAGVSRQALDGWKKRPEFAARVEEHLEAFRARVRRRGIAIAERRVEALQDRWERMRRVIDERAEEMEGECPGGGTGLLVRQYKAIGSGEYAEKVTEYQVDTGLLKEMRAHEQQAAQELGQWLDRQVHSGPDGGPIVVKKIGGVSTDDL